MSSFWSTAVLVAVAADPVGAMVVAPAALARVGAAGSTARRVAAVTAGAGLGLWVLAALVSGPLFDAADVSPESAQIAAGLVLLVPAFHMVAAGHQRELVDEAPAGAVPWWRVALVPLAVPVVAGPAQLAVAAALAGRRGVVVTVGAAALAAAVVALAVAAGPSVCRRAGWAPTVFGRLAGAAMAVAAFDLVADGVLAV